MRWRLYISTLVTTFAAFEAFFRTYLRELLHKTQTRVALFSYFCTAVLPNFFVTTAHFCLILPPLSPIPP